MDVLAEMPKFPEHQSSLIKKVEEVEDTADQRAIKLRVQQLPSNALVLADPKPVNGTPPPLKVPSMSGIKVNGTPLPLAIEVLPGEISSQQRGLTEEEGVPSEVDGTAIAPVGEQANTVEPIGNIAKRFHALCLKDSGVLYEDPYIQIGVKAEWRGHHGRLTLFRGNKNTSPLTSVKAIILPPAHLQLELSLIPDTIPPRAQVQCPLEVMNIRPSRDVAVLDLICHFLSDKRVIERAYKKLTRDALVIQQGRLAEQTTVNKEELLQMVRYGAEIVFSSKDSSITYEDIDRIIAKGEETTAELDAKMMKFTEDAIQFKMDDSADSYAFDDDTKDENKLDNLRATFDHELKLERSSRQELVIKMQDLTSELIAKISKSLSLNEQRSVLVHLTQMVFDLELEKATHSHPLSRYETEEAKSRIQELETQFTSSNSEASSVTKKSKVLEGRRKAYEEQLAEAFSKSSSFKEELNQTMGKTKTKTALDKRNQ